MIRVQMKLKAGFIINCFATVVMISALSACSSYNKVVRDHYDTYLYTTPEIGPALAIPGTSNLVMPEQSMGRYPLPNDFKALQGSSQTDLSPPNILKK
ncbi:hypothetical protein Psal006b_01938 [Piscirickettsia salmonis]|uniref:Lipoprotein n=2 Tax=Piscirickettsia salmonis TaxID=1238 RepID=A0AAC8ZNW5_PISSA|nr:hypothetical protein [Piscirickettsia salmonis]ALB22456.1 lipoprotein [Piscirickettsia salmonis]QGN98939.1 hypothetical protein Psal006b_01938 [Piscirickettsia salmonis]QGO02568.1 hypothetical protein Psal008_01957 [Piscirickettsia salmonis]QGO13238.1 hypothetical protein Psal010b_01935 [Piscirickettsia salmonis]QGO66901.1 hypothetical protein Psal073_01863 [Piscirickettsia salmonis]